MVYNTHMVSIPVTFHAEGLGAIVIALFILVGMWVVAGWVLKLIAYMVAFVVLYWVRSKKE